MNVALAIGVVAAMGVSIVGLGLGAVAALRIETPDAALLAAVVVVLGAMATAVVTVAAGHLHLLRPALLVAVAAAGTVGTWLGRGSLPRRPWHRAPLTWFDRALNAIIALALGGMLVAGLRHPWAADELDYHWTAPLHWAAIHHWGHSPFRLTNGPALMEWLYTLPALTGSYQAAHWLHTLTFGAAMLAAASLARSLEVNPRVAAAAVLSITAAANQAAWAYNDAAAGAFALVAAAVVFSPANLRHRYWVAGIVVAAAALVKPLMLGALPALVVGGLVMAGSLRGRELARAALALAAPSVVALLAVAVRTLALTGKVTDVQSGYIRHYGTPLWWLGAGFYPDLRHTLLLPIEPFFTGAVGQSEPWGGRTGIFVLVFLPLAVLAYALLPSRSHLTSALLATGAIFLVDVGIVFPRTRFLFFAYAFFALFAIAVLQDQWEGSSRSALLLRVTVVVTIALSVADAAHVWFKGAG